MVGIDTAEVTSGYRERIRRLALFDSLHELDRKKGKDDSGKELDMKGLGLLTLLFFFEQKIMRNPRVDRVSIAEYLQETSREVYSLTQEGWLNIASSIIETFRPSDGKKKLYPFFDWELRTEEEIVYSLLKTNTFDVKTNTQYYTLDEDGLELIFATKEFYSEFQLSINQLMLRKQLEKGEFKGALRQINEMRLDVESLKERMVKLKHEVQRSIVSEETFERYEVLLDDVHFRLEHENIEFSELRQFVKETKERLYSQDVHVKEKKTYQYIVEITNELEEVHYDHSRLLEMSIEVKNHTLKAAQESLYYTGIDAFNFEQDILMNVLAAPLPLDAVKGLLHPFLKVGQAEIWSPLNLFAEQNIREEREGATDYTFIEQSEKEAEVALEKERKFQEVVLELGIEAIESGADDIKGIISHIRKTREELLHERLFYDFWMLLHQRSPILSRANEASDDTAKGLEELMRTVGIHSFLVTELMETIHVTDRFSIQNMHVQIGKGEEDEL